MTRFFFGMFIGFLIAFPIIPSYYQFASMQAIENNVSMREFTYTYFQSAYKEKYTDWKQFEIKNKGIK